MSFFRIFLYFALALTSAPIFAETGDLSAANQEALQLSIDRGLDIYRYDQAAWHTTDTMREDMEDIEASGIRGWVVTETGDGLLTVFWRPDGDGFAGVYSAVWNKDGVSGRQILSGDQTRLTDEQIGLIKALRAVDAQKLTRCSKSPFNTVVLPARSDDEPILVYYMTPQTSLDAIPLGGHYRFEIKDGNIVNDRAFTNSCIDLTLSNDDAKDKPVASYITHLLDPIPTEIHVFSAFATRIPIYVGTTSDKSVWAVEISDGQPVIRKIE